MAELAGASHDQIRRQGRWNCTSLDSCYLTNLPRKILRTTAGFSPIQGKEELGEIQESNPAAVAKLELLIKDRLNFRFVFVFVEIQGF